MRIIKPQHLGILPRPYTFKNRHTLCIGTLLFFRLGHKDSHRHIVQEHLAWPDVCRALPTGTPLDMGIDKLRGEAFLAGTACTPGGKPQTRLPVRLQVGSIDKQLLVQGDRQWQYGLIPTYQHTAAQPFSRLPLTFDHAFGGVGCPANELGRGYHNRKLPAYVGVNHGALPNVEYPGTQTKAGAHAYPPASFLPFDFNAPQRRKKAGTYNQQWVEQDHPGFARNIDWSIFNAGPKDQWLKDTSAGPDFFQGGEPYQLHGVHPEHPVLAGCLPDVRARTFVRTADESCKEVSSQADTVWFFPDYALGAMIFHAKLAVQDDEGLDVQAAMVAYELKQASPRPHSHYSEVLQLRSVDKTAALHAFNESQLCPPRAQASAADRHAEQLANNQARIDDSIQELREAGAQLPADFAPPQAAAPLFPQLDPEAVASGDFDLTGVVEGAEATAAELESLRKLQLQELQQKTPAPSPRMVDISAEVKAALARADGSHQEAQLAHLGMPQDAKQAAALAGLQEQMGKLAIVAPKAPPEPAAQAVGDCLAHFVAHLLAAGGSLRGIDLTGVRLRDLDLSNQDLRGTGFAYSVLTRVKFNGAQLSGATFAHARLDKVQLDKANLSHLQLDHATLNHCTLSGAKLHTTQWGKAQLRDCDLSHTHGKDTLYFGTKLTNCRFDHAQMQGGAWMKVEAKDLSFHYADARQLSFMQCNLQSVDWSHATLHKVVWLGTQATNARFDEARLLTVLFSGKSQLLKASFRKATARDCGFHSSDLSGSDFTEAILSRCDLAKAQLNDTCFETALVSRCGLRQAVGHNANFQNADLYHSTLTKSDWTHANFRRTSLCRAELGGTVWESADLKDAHPQPEKRA